MLMTAYARYKIDSFQLLNSRWNSVRRYASSDVLASWNTEQKFCLRKGNRSGGFVVINDDQGERIYDLETVGRLE